MQDLVQVQVPDVIRDLDKTRHHEAEPADRDKALEETTAQQEKVAAAMREILKHMVKAEGYQEAVNLLYEIQKTQEKVHDLTLEKKQERIRNILENKPTSENPDDGDKPNGDKPNGGEQPTSPEKPEGGSP